MEKDVWKPIADLPENWADLASKELEALAPIWLEKYEELQRSLIVNPKTKGN